MRTLPWDRRCSPTYARTHTCTHDGSPPQKRTELEPLVELLERQVGVGVVPQGVGRVAAVAVVVCVDVVVVV